jgi:hypothetical protein
LPFLFVLLELEVNHKPLKPYSTGPCISSNPENMSQNPWETIRAHMKYLCRLAINKLCILREVINSQSWILALPFPTAQSCVFVARALIVVNDIVSKTYAE